MFSLSTSFESCERIKVTAFKNVKKGFVNIDDSKNPLSTNTESLNSEMKGNTSKGVMWLQQT